jgi:hypothetical protein
MLPNRYPVAVVMVGLGVTVIESKFIACSCMGESRYVVPLPDTTNVPGKIVAAVGVDIPATVPLPERIEPVGMVVELLNTS